MNTDLLNDIHKKGSVSLKTGVLLQHNLTNYFNVITNFYYDNIGTNFAEYSYIITATKNFSNRWSAFFENQTIFQEYQKNTNLGIGLAYLYRRNLQFNTSARLLFEGEAKGYYAGFGISYRVDTHRDSFIELGQNGQELKDTAISAYNKKQNNFFNRILNVFKKKEKPLRRRPERKRKTRSRKKRGGVFGLFGKKKKNETEVEKLEREIKELEEEMKKEAKKNKKNGKN